MRQWHLIDAEDAVLGRLASKAAMLLMGKHKPMLHAVSRYGRSRGGGECGEGQAHRP